MEERAADLRAIRDLIERQFSSMSWSVGGGPDTAWYRGGTANDGSVRWRQIINTASIGAYVVAPTAAVYCTTKYAVWAISEGLRQESQKIRVPIISPGVVETDLSSDITDESSKGFLKELCKTVLASEAIARAVLYAVSQPDDVDVNEVIVRPIRQMM